MKSAGHRFAFTSDQPTKTIVGPEATVLLTNAPEELRGLVFPLMSIEFDGRDVPWMYTQMYGRHSDGSPLVLKSYQDGSSYRVDERSLDEIRSFHAACGLGPTAQPRSWLRRYLDWVDFDVDHFGRQPVDHEERWVWIERIQEALREHESDAQKLFRGQSNIYRGPDPIWLQDDQTPVGPTGERMEFLGQVDASLLTNDAADSCHYLFWSPNDGSLAQVTQLS